MLADFDKEIQELNERLLNKNYSKIEKYRELESKRQQKESTKKKHKIITKILKR